jgi:hypothetical protein
MKDQSKSQPNAIQHRPFTSSFGAMFPALFFLTAMSGCGAGRSSVTASLSAPTTTVSVQLPVLTSGNPINITAGGTYSGSWFSNDPSVPAVQVNTDAPVVIQNSVVSGLGNLIVISGKTGANVTIRNVTGTGLDPMVAGAQRGSFLRAFTVNSLVVENCTMKGTTFGILVYSSTVTNLKLLYNVGSELEDRTSDGKGGFQTSRPSLGHFIQIGRSTVPNGAEVAWNQLKQTIGSSSTEDPINIYLALGAGGKPIWIHDNYMEGNSSPAKPTYSGNGIIADGDVTGQTGYILFQDNEIVHTQGGGVAIANGHDITAQGNRIVSCGKDSLGNMYTQVGPSAIGLVNYYNASGFYNNTINTTAGGMVSLDSAGNLVVNDIYAATIDATDTITNNNFTDPCFKAGVLNTSAEDDERAFWANKLSTNSIVLGDQH